MKTLINLQKKQDRRSGYDRRQFSYTIHIPERRSQKDRRSGKDRRRDQNRRRPTIDTVPDSWSEFDYNHN